MFAYLVNMCIQSDEYRDTVFSIISLITNLFGSVLLFIFGAVGLEARYNYVLLGIVAIALVVILFFTKWRQNRPEHMSN